MTRQYILQFLLLHMLLLRLNWLEHARRGQCLIVLGCAQIDQHMPTLPIVVVIRVLVRMVLLVLACQGTLLGTPNRRGYDQVKAQLTWLHVLVLLLLTKSGW